MALAHDEVETGGRRRLVAPAIIVAALLVVGAVLWSTNRGGEAGPGTATAHPSPTATTEPTSTGSPTSAASTRPTPPPTGDGDAAVRTVAVDPQAPIVERPELPYLLDTVLHRGSTTRTFPVEATFEYLPLRDDGALLLDEFAGYEWDRVQLLDADGETLLALVAKPTHFLWAAADADGARFAVLDSPDAGTSDAILTLYDSRGMKLLTRTGVVDRLRIVGFVGDRVFLRSAEQYGGTYVWTLTDNTVTPYADWAVVAVNGPSGRAALVAPGDYHEPRCTLVADVRGPTPEPISTTCGAFAAQELSPDGRYLLGTELDPDDPWFQPPSRVIDVATGRPVVVLGEPTPVRVRSAFLSDGSVGFVLMQSAGVGWTNGLVRCSLDGECSRMVKDVAVPYVEEGPRSRYRLVRAGPES